MAEPLRTWSHNGKRETANSPPPLQQIFPGLKDGPVFGAQVDGICAYNRAQLEVGVMRPDPGEITQLLQQWRTGDRQVEDRLFDLLMPDLHQIAERCFRRERP